MLSLLKRESTMNNNTVLDWKEPTAQCCCGNKLYLPPDECGNFTGSSINLINDTPIELWESNSISENLLLDFTDKNKGNTILFPTEDLADLPW
ncbi:4581_t:CDS:2 [Dentiscutata erythropus]|uniref:4581_t:CDS:1 n=1 Tax=Dentiscutata erythropus TaxID=1348616 RepID=A0A9N9ERG5_9GLOM|nr:4581_t:CDS:2 [Dentiscutata erythropus]